MSELIPTPGLVLRSRIFGPCSPYNRKPARADFARMLLFLIRRQAASRESNWSLCSFLTAIFIYVKIFLIMFSSE